MLKIIVCQSVNSPPDSTEKDPLHPDPLTNYLHYLMKKLLLTLLCLAMSTMLFAQTLRNGSGNGLNLRSEPNTNSTVITSIPHNAKVTVLDQNNSEWYKVQYDGKTGYASAKYLQEHANRSNNVKNNAHNNSRSNNSSRSAVTYNTGIGIRFGGWESGLTVKHFIKSNAAIEGILSSGWHYRGTRITGLYEIQKSISGAPGLYWFYGVGAHIGFYNESYWYSGDCKDGRYEYQGRWYKCDGTRATIGIDGIIGLEYHFSEIPFTIGLDLKPSIGLIGWGGRYGDSAFTVRYAF